ncbi:MAG: hypothetical protein ABIN92_04165 [Ferruginibacter sp.]
MLICGQQTTSFGDEVGTLDGIIKAYYDVVTVKKGEKVSFERDSVLHIPNAIVGITQKDKYGKAILKMISLRQFHNASDAFIEQDGFNEHELARKVENFGSIYQVWSTYETRNISTGPLLERGINSIQLYHDGKRFWIISWIAEDETKQQPIPEKYLINSK